MFLTNGTEVRMNGNCAGGTRCLHRPDGYPAEDERRGMNKAAEQAQRTYTIASAAACSPKAMCSR